MEIEEPSEPQNLQIRCPGCRKPLPVKLADLRENESISCHLCNQSFKPNVDIDILLNLMKETEEARLDSDLIM